jgi:hypothetical protein
MHVKRQYLSLLLASPLSILAVGLWIIIGPKPIDDAYITFRYARNLAEGIGLVYNPCEHVLGTTTPLFSLVLALLYLVTYIEIPWRAIAQWWKLS